MNARRFKLSAASAHASPFTLLRPVTALLTWLAAASLSTLFVSCSQQPQTGKATEPTPQAGTATPSPIPWKTIEPPSQVGVAEGTPRARQSTGVRTFSGTGVVRLVNLKEGWVEIDHEEIVGLMPAMQMEWSVKDSAMLTSIRAGDKVDFVIEDNNGSEVILELKKVPNAR